MRLHAMLSHPHAPPPREPALKELVHTQAFKDRLYVAAVTALVVLTLALFAGYAIYQLPQWRAGGVGGFDTHVLPLPNPDGAEEAAIVSSATGMNRTGLIVTSMLVEAVIFVGLGFYLRHEMNRKP